MGKGIRKRVAFLLVWAMVIGMFGSEHVVLAEEGTSVEDSLAGGNLQNPTEDPIEGETSNSTGSAIENKKELESSDFGCVEEVTYDGSWPNPKDVVSVVTQELGITGDNITDYIEIIYRKQKDDGFVTTENLVTALEDADTSSDVEQENDTAMNVGSYDVVLKQINSYDWEGLNCAWPNDSTELVIGSFEVKPVSIAEILEKLTLKEIECGDIGNGNILDNNDVKIAFPWLKDWKKELEISSNNTDGSNEQEMILSCVQTENYYTNNVGDLLEDAPLVHIKITISDVALQNTNNVKFSICAQLTRTEAVDASCETEGNTEYWTCETCGKYFSYDKEGKLKEIEEDSWIIPATGHPNLKKTEAVDASCETEGNTEYWTCETCGKYFSYDEEGKLKEIEEDSWIIPATGHPNLKKTEAVDASCETEGNTEYWTCEDCGKYFSYDEEGKLKEIEEDSWIIPATGHQNLKKTEAVDASCEKEGNTEYWTCEDCGKYFSYDEEGKLKEIDKDSWIIPARGHQYVNGVCQVCKKKDPNFIPKVKKTVTVTLGKSISVSKIVTKGIYEEMSLRNAKKYKKYFKIDSKAGKITTKKYYKVKITKTIPVKVMVNGKIYTVQVKIKIPAPKVKIKVEKYTYQGVKGRKFTFRYNVKGASKIRVRLKNNGGRKKTINRILDDYVGKPKSDKNSWIKFQNKLIKKMRGKVTFYIVAYYGKNQSEKYTKTFKID